MILILKEKPFTIYIISGIPSRSEELHRAMKSALEQDYTNYNIVIRIGYEDPIAKSLATDRVIFSPFNGTEIGIGKRLGLNLAESLEHFNDYVCFLDDDDYFDPKKLKRINEEFENDCVYVHNSIIAVDENGKEVQYSNGRDDFNMSSISVNKRVIDRQLFLGLNSSLDTAIYLCAINIGKLRFSRDKLTYYTIHSSTTLGFFGNIEEWRTRKLHSYLDIIQPTYEYFVSYFKDTPAEVYAMKLLNMNKLFIRIYSGNNNKMKVSLLNVLKTVLFKQYYQYRDTFASKVILASYLSRKMNQFSVSVLCFTEAM